MACLTTAVSNGAKTSTINLYRQCMIGIRDQAYGRKMPVHIFYLADDTNPIYHRLAVNHTCIETLINPDLMRKRIQGDTFHFCELKIQHPSGGRIEQIA